MERMWINQPSMLQPLHNLHGVNVLYDAARETVYFLSGNTISMMPPKNTLSNGWRGS